MPRYVEISQDRMDRDPEAFFAEFVRTHHERAVRMAWRLTGGDRATAEDLAQECFLAAHTHLPSLREPEALEGWFFRIVTRRAANHRRWAGVRRRFARLFVPEPAPAPQDPEPALRARIERALSMLSESQRDVFVLVYLEGFTLDQSAEMLGKAPGTVRTHLHRALKALRQDLTDVMDEL